MHGRKTAVAIMAAGQGKRMKNPDTAKVMNLLGGTPLIEHVIRAARQLDPERIIVIAGFRKEQVMNHLAAIAPDVRVVIQEEQLGTGHAVMQCETALENFEGDLVVLSGDVPLTTPETLRSLLDTHVETGAVATALTALLDDPTGYGRVIRDEKGYVQRVVEHKDANEEERAVPEINAGIYAFRKTPLFQALRRITNDNAQGEFYLPDVISLFVRDGLRVAPVIVASFDELRGVNTVEQLAEMESIFQRRKTQPQTATS